MPTSFDIRYFAHSWVSDWNYSSSHFLRGLARELLKAGQKVRCYEELGSWSLSNLIKQEDECAVAAIDDFRKAYSTLKIQFYKNDACLQEWMARELRGAEIVILHEWNHPRLVNLVLALKQTMGFRVLLHDTSHRVLAAPREILQFQLHLFDGVLAYAKAIHNIYADSFGVERVWVFHEAADVRAFHPMVMEKTTDVLWVGHSSDEERMCDVEEFLLQPAAQLHRLKFAAYGAGYSEQMRSKLVNANIDFRGYLCGIKAREVYNQSKIVLHIPHHDSQNGLSSIPGIEMFEAMACRVPVLNSCHTSAEEGLFHAGQDYLCAESSAAMKDILQEMDRDEDARSQIAGNGYDAIRQHHTCAHRAAQLIEICQEL